MKGWRRSRWHPSALYLYLSRLATSCRNSPQNRGWKRRLKSRPELAQANVDISLLSRARQVGNQTGTQLSLNQIYIAPWPAIQVSCSIHGEAGWFSCVRGREIVGLDRLVRWGWLAAARARLTESEPGWEGLHVAGGLANAPSPFSLALLESGSHLLTFEPENLMMESHQWECDKANVHSQEKKKNVIGLVFGSTLAEYLKHTKLPNIQCPSCPLPNILNQSLCLWEFSKSSLHSPYWKSISHFDTLIYPSRKLQNWRNQKNQFDYHNGATWRIQWAQMISSLTAELPPLCYNC
jgi:hypothetical protein